MIHPIVKYGDPMLETPTKPVDKFDEELQAAAGRIEMSAPLDPSPEYRELVYESSKLDVIEDRRLAPAPALGDPAQGERGGGRNGIEQDPRASGAVQDAT